MRLFFAIMLTVLMLTTGCSKNSAPVPTPESASGQPTPEETVSETIPSEEIMSEATLSAELQTAFLKEVSQQQNVAAEQLSIVEIKEADWPDGCLGLAGPDEFCTQMIVPGWAIAVSDGNTTWNYRTDLDMLQVKLDKG